MEIPASEALMSVSAAKRPGSGRVTAHELMPLIVRIAFERQNGKAWEGLRQEVDRCKYRNELALLKK